MAFILSPARSHGLGTKPLQIFLRALLAKLPADKRPIPALEVAVGDLDDATVFREVDYIDLLIEVRELNLIVVIENKVDAQAGEGQLALRDTWPKANHCRHDREHLDIADIAAQRVDALWRLTSIILKIEPRGAHRS